MSSDKVVVAIWILIGVIISTACWAELKNEYPAWCFPPTTIIIIMFAPFFALDMLFRASRSWFEEDDDER